MRTASTTLGALLQEINAHALQEAVAICEALHELEERGKIDAFRARYPGLRRYFPAFYALPFPGEPGNDHVLEGLDLVRQLDAGTQKALPRLAPRPLSPASFGRP